MSNIDKIEAMQATMGFVLGKLDDLERKNEVLENKLKVMETVVHTGTSDEDDSWYSLDGVPEAYRAAIKDNIDKIKGGIK